MCRHLGHRFIRMHPNLLHKEVKRQDQILNKVKVIVVHVRRHHDRRRCRAFIVQLTRVLVRDQVVLDPVDQEGRRLHLRDLFNVVEAVLDQVLDVAAGLVLHDVSNRFERRHEEQSTGSTFTCDVGGRTAADASTEDNDV